MSEYFENKKICESCGGKCCKNIPGCCYPEDFDFNIELVKKALSSGKYAVDWWEGESDEYFVRPATKGKEWITFDPSWGGECTFLMEEGCSLSAKDRPKECRNLEPVEGDGDCVHHGQVGKKNSAEAWGPFWEFFDELRYGDNYFNVVVG